MCRSQQTWNDHENRTILAILQNYMEPIDLNGVCYFPEPQGTHRSVQHFKKGGFGNRVWLRTNLLNLKGSRTGGLIGYLKRVSRKTFFKTFLKKSFFFNFLKIYFF